MVRTSIEAHTMVATAEDTAVLAETYVAILDRGDVDTNTSEAFAERVSELNTIGLGLLDREDAGADGIRSRLDEAADAAFKAAGLDGVAGR